MSLVEHAQRELHLCGQAKEDPGYAASLVAAVAAFASYGHSGGSAGCAIQQLVTLLNYGTLSPLTDDPGEWHDVSGMSGAPMWQSRRNPQAFSQDGGKTYYLLDEVDEVRRKAAEAAGRPMHASRPSRATQADSVAVNACEPLADWERRVVEDAYASGRARDGLVEGEASS